MNMATNWTLILMLGWTQFGLVATTCTGNDIDLFRVSAIFPGALVWVLIVVRFWALRRARRAGRKIVDEHLWYGDKITNQISASLLFLLSFRQIWIGCLLVYVGLSGYHFCDIVPANGPLPLSRAWERVLGEFTALDSLAWISTVHWITSGLACLLLATYSLRLWTSERS
jgi:hypothetical protein